MEKKQRLWGLDAVRACAVILVLTTHAIAYLGPLDQNFATPVWGAWLYLRYLAMACVPLFLILTGYLSGKRELNLRYFAGILPVLVSYAVISLLAECMHYFYFHTNVDVKHAVFHVFNFSAHGYAWYVEMYVGLFLLIPFLNVLWRALESRGNRLALVAVLVVLTMLPPAVESFGSVQTRLDILPDYWKNVYPLTYYYIGAFLKEYPPRLPKGVNLLLLGGAVLVPTLLRCWAAGPENGASYVMNGFGCVTTAAIGVLLFLLLHDLNCPVRPLRAAVTGLSLCSFEIYLCSYLTDRLLYANWKGPLPVTVLISLLAAWLLAWLLRLALVPLSRLLTKGYARVCARISSEP